MSRLARHGAIAIARTRTGVPRANRLLHAPRASFATATPVAAVPAAALSETMQQDNKYILRTYARQPIELVRGDGVWLWDAEGKKYMGESEDAAIVFRAEVQGGIERSSQTHPRECICHFFRFS
jgi:hypothetical protein